MSNTETLDRLYLELSQFTTATTARELALERQAAHLCGVLRLIAFGLPDADGVTDPQHLAWVALGRPDE